MKNVLHEIEFDLYSTREYERWFVFAALNARNGWNELLAAHAKLDELYPEH